MMKRWMVWGLGVMLLLPVAAQARHHNAATPSPSPSASPSASPTATDKHSFDMTATLLSSFETKNSDGDPSRDDIVLIEGLTRTGPGSAGLSATSFCLKDPKTGVLYPADTTNDNDLNGDPDNISASDGTLDTFKVYFTIPGTLRPTKIYLKVGDTVEEYPLGM